jgi:hypothetical protein
VLVLGQATVAAVVAATMWAAGSIVSGALRRARGDAPPPWSFTMALGFAVVAQLLLLAALAGMLRKPVVLAIVIGIHLAALPAWRRLIAGAGALGLRVPIVGLVAAGALPAFLLTLYPPLGFDQTMYHLPFARAFAASGSAPFLPALRFPMFPPLAEMLNAAVLMFAGDVATQATGWVALAACVGLAYAWACDLAGDTRASEPSRASHGSGWLAVAVIVGSPIALYLAASGYVEPLLALFGGAALYAAERARITGERSWLVAAGVLAGSAASVKYHGLYFVPAAVILIVRRAPWRVMLRELAIYGVAAAVALLPAYGRLVARTGNPVFPFYPELFGPNAWAEEVIMGPTGAARWLLTATRLWDITFRRDAIGGMPHYSPAFLIALPIIAIAAWRHPRFRALLAIAIGYMIAAPTHAHHLFPIAVLWSVLAGASAAALWPAPARSKILIAAAVILACGGEAYALHRLYRLGPPPVTSEDRDRLLALQRPLYEPIAWLNGVVGPVTLYAVHAEMMVYYASGTLLGDYNGPASFDRMEARIRETGSVAAALDAIGATHLLVPTPTPFWGEQAARDPRLARIYDDGRAILYRVDPR